jgi:hypothetical protein
MPELKETIARLRKTANSLASQGYFTVVGITNTDLQIVLDAAEEVEKLRADKERLLEECRDKRAWLQWKLETAIVHVPAEYDLGRKTSDGWGAVRIPDWDVKQKIQSLNETIIDALQTHGRVPESTPEAKQEASPARKEKADA